MVAQCAAVSRRRLLLLLHRDPEADAPQVRGHHGERHELIVCRRCMFLTAHGHVQELCMVPSTDWYGACACVFRCFAEHRGASEVPGSCQPQILLLTPCRSDSDDVRLLCRDILCCVFVTFVSVRLPGHRGPQPHVPGHLAPEQHAAPVPAAGEPAADRDTTSRCMSHAVRPRICWLTCGYNLQGSTHARLLTIQPYMSSA